MAKPKKRVKKQKLSIKAAKNKAKRDKAFAMTPSRRAKKAENQRLRRKAKKRGVNLRGKLGFTERFIPKSTADPQPHT